MAEILLNIIGISALIAVPSNSILLGLNSGKLNFREIFGKKKSKGYEAILNKISTVAAVAFIAVSLALVTIE